MEVDEHRGVLRLRCSVKNYDWGRIGNESQVARLYAFNSADEIEDSKPYAEFWMGTHDSGPSFLVNFIEKGGVLTDPERVSVSLKHWISQNARVLGDKVVRKWGTDLPFLFKVLSVGKALSIQAHPDKELAGILHKMHPDVYKDGNHKPEMALALTEFEALCGFISFEELKGVLQNVPEIKEVIGITNANQMLLVDEQDREEKEKAVLRSIFTTLMSASKEVISNILSKLICRLSTEKKARRLSSKEELALRLEKQYPDDVGVIATFLFNHVTLSPGEALYLGANELHAYLFGDCIECMAASDNVVRAGLTPKNRDVKTLCDMLTYKQGFPEILEGVPLNPHTRRYSPPFDEFEVDRCILEESGLVVFPAIPGPSIFVVIMGKGDMHTSLSTDTIAEGDVLFAPANIEISITNGGSRLHLYRAGVNSRFYDSFLM